MKKLFLAVVSAITAFSAQAQFLDVEQISKPRASRSIMFQDQEESAPNVKQASQPEKAPQKVTPKKSAPADNVAFFKKGDAKILAIVNGDAISTNDIDSYARLFVMNTGVPLNNKTKPMIINKVLQMTIDEKIKRQEAEKNNVTVSAKDLSSALSQYEAQRKMPLGSLDKKLKQKGINPNIVKEQIKTEIMWARLVRRKMASEMHITQREIEDAIKRSEEDMKSPKYKVSEIVIPVAKAKNISVLVDNIRRDGVFNMYAAQFSQSPSAANGGSLGWVKEGQLAKPLEDKVKKMRVGQVSEAVKHDGNYYILKLDDKFMPTGKEKKISDDDMKNVLEIERLEGYSAKYLQNLRQRSIIEFKS